jgi:hypothetical protein
MTVSKDEARGLYTPKCGLEQNCDAYEAPRCKQRNGEGHKPKHSVCLRAYMHKAKRTLSFKGTCAMHAMPTSKSICHVQKNIFHEDDTFIGKRHIHLKRKNTTHTQRIHTCKVIDACTHTHTHDVRVLQQRQQAPTRRRRIRPRNRRYSGQISAHKWAHKNSTHTPRRPG